MHLNERTIDLSLNSEYYIVILTQEYYTNEVMKFSYRVFDSSSNLKQDVNSNNVLNSPYLSFYSIDPANILIKFLRY